MSAIEEIAQLGDDDAHNRILHICDLTDATMSSADDNMAWGTTRNNTLLARGLFLAGMCSAVENEIGRAGFLGWNGCIFGRYELEDACMISQVDEDDCPAMRRIVSREDVDRCVKDVAQEIQRLKLKTECEFASKDALRVLATIFHGRYGWSCSKLSFGADELLSAVSLPKEAEELLDSMRAEVRKNKE